MEIHLAASEHPTYCHYSSEDHTRVASRKGPAPVSVGLASSWGEDCRGKGCSLAFSAARKPSRTDLHFSPRAEKGGSENQRHRRVLRERPLAPVTEDPLPVQPEEALKLLRLALERLKPARRCSLRRAVCAASASSWKST